MQRPPQIAFDNLPHSPALEQAVRERVAKLEEFCGRITGCRVVVSVPHRHHAHGNLYEVRIDLAVPGEEITINREAPPHVEYRDIHVAIRDAFDAARRRLEDYVRRRRHDVKTREPAAQSQGVAPE
jgi:ribosome-associated translation inhibitor RaiA